MRTTLKRGIGRGADLNGNGHAVLPPGVLTPIALYRQPPRAGRSIGRRLAGFLFWVVVLVAMVAGGAAGGLYLYGHDFASATAPHSRALKRAAKRLDYAAPGKPAIALVLGTDHRYVDGKAPGRSDTMMLIRTDPGSHTVSLLSFPRDMRVAIHCPGRSVWYDKINAAYPTCGPLGSLETIKELTHVPINYLISVNFLGFIQVVDKLGGVYMDVDRRYFNNHRGPTGYAGINLEAGYQRLSGKQALDFVRYRHTDSDLFRVIRQQAFVRAAKEQLGRYSKFHVSSLLGAIKRNVEVGRAGGPGLPGPAAPGPGGGGSARRVGLPGNEGLLRHQRSKVGGRCEGGRQALRRGLDRPNDAEAASVRQRGHARGRRRQAVQRLA